MHSAESKAAPSGLARLLARVAALEATIDLAASPALTCLLINSDGGQDSNWDVVEGRQRESALACGVVFRAACYE